MEDRLLMTMFIPLFFLVVNTGQAAKIFPSDSTEFLQGQSYGAFQLPITLLLAASFGMAALFLVEEIEGGYLDKLRAMPTPRYALVLGRLSAEALKGIVIVLVALPFGITIASGVFGFVLLVLPAVGLDAELRPPRDARQADGNRRHGEPGELPDGGAALADPRALGLGTVGLGFAVVAGLGAVMLALTARMIQSQD